MAKKKPRKYDWEEALQDDLAEALSEYKHLPLLGQLRCIQALATYLTWRVPGELLEPLESIYTRLMDEAAVALAQDRPGPAPAPLSEQIVEARAAGTVTVLKRCGWKVGEAVTKVAKLTGLDPHRLRYLRDEIHRGRASKDMRDIYKSHLDDFGRITEMTREELATYVLDVCAKFYAPGRPFRRRFDL